MDLSSIIRQKGKSQNGCFRKQSAPNFPKSKHFVPSDTHTYVCVSVGKKYSFFGKFSVLYFLETTVLRFALLPYYRRHSDLQAKRSINVSSLYYEQIYRNCVNFSPSMNSWLKNVLSLFRYLIWKYIVKIVYLSH